MSRASTALLSCAYAAVACTGCGGPGAADSEVQAAVLSRAQVPPALAGCYALYDGAGRPAIERWYLAPAVARLEVTDGPTGRVTRLEDATSATAAINVMTQAWRVDSLADTLRLTFHNGFGGTGFAFAFHSDTDSIRGRAIGYTDNGPPFETDEGPAVAVRVRCP